MHAHVKHIALGDGPFACAKPPSWKHAVVECHGLLPGAELCVVVARCVDGVPHRATAGVIVVMVHVHVRACTWVWV
jgi:hypothetical protein